MHTDADMDVIGYATKFGGVGPFARFHPFAFNVEFDVAGSLNSRLSNNSRFGKAMKAVNLTNLTNPCTQRGQA